MNGLLPICYRIRQHRAGLDGLGKSDLARKIGTYRNVAVQNRTATAELQNRCSTAELTRHIKDLASEPAFCHRIAIARK